MGEHLLTNARTVKSLNLVPLGHVCLSQGRPPKELTGDASRSLWVQMDSRTIIKKHRSHLVPNTGANRLLFLHVPLHTRQSEAQLSLSWLRRLRQEDCPRSTLYYRIVWKESTTEKDNSPMASPGLALSYPFCKLGASAHPYPWPHSRF